MRDDTYLLEGMSSNIVFKSQVHPDWFIAAREKGYSITPSIHMPKSFCRIWLEIEDIKLERLHDITEEDAINEGIERKVVSDEIDHIYAGKVHYRYKNYLADIGDDDQWYRNPIDSFASFWISINGFDSWKLNPWVWVIKSKHTYNRPEGFLI